MAEYTLMDEKTFSVFALCFHASSSGQTGLPATGPPSSRNNFLRGNAANRRMPNRRPQRCERQNRMGRKSRLTKSEKVSPRENGATEFFPNKYQRIINKDEMIKVLGYKNKFKINTGLLWIVDKFNWMVFIYFFPRRNPPSIPAPRSAV